MNRLVLVVCAMVAWFGAYGKPVNPNLARQVARNILQKDVLAMEISSLTECMLFGGVDGEGFVLLSGDDCVRPLLAYSHEGRFPADDMPAHVRQWIDGYQQEISSAKAIGVPQSSKVAEEWQRLLKGPMKSGGSGVLPLMETTWGQGVYYNSQCPIGIGSESHMAAGCVATAMAQVMRYWQHPSTGRGSHSYYSPAVGTTLQVDYEASPYAWGRMPDALTAASTQDEVDAVARLVYEVGVALETRYSNGSSIAYMSSFSSLDSSSAETAFREHFLYHPGLHSVFKSSKSDAQWRAIASAELDAGRPLLYAGQGLRGGHAFVVDGYDSLQLFHVNWGWDGNYNGYYNLDSLVINASDGRYAPYNRNNEMLVGVCPVYPSASDYSLTGVSADNSVGAVAGSGIFAADTMRVTLTANAAEGYVFDHWAGGAINNPLLYTPTADYADTAHFRQLGGDTVGYCRNFGYDWYGHPEWGTVTWGIRIPEQLIPSHRQLDQIRLVTQDAGQYTITVYSGHQRQSVLFSEEYHFDTPGWQTVEPEYPLPVYDTAPLWITISVAGVECVTQRSLYTGNPDGAWLYDGFQWRPAYEVDGTYGTWMIQALFAEAEQVCLTLRSNNDGWGSVYGGGCYFPGDSVTVSAEPAGDLFDFDYWSDGTLDNPYTFIIEADLTLTAIFSHRSGIDSPDDQPINVETQGLRLTIYNPEGHMFALFDIAGRQLLPPSQAASASLTLPASGVYVLRANGQSARRIVAVK